MKLYVCESKTHMSALGVSYRNLVEAEKKKKKVGMKQTNTVRGRTSMERTISNGHTGITLVELIKVR